MCIKSQNAENINDLLPNSAHGEQLQLDIPLFDKEDLPTGWQRGFAACLEEDLRKAIVENGVVNFKTVQIKEKFGTLRLYYNVTYDGTKNADDAIEQVITAYEHISARTCIVCGAFPVPIADWGWLSPICKECYESNNLSRRPYKDVIVDSSRFDPRFKVHRYRPRQGEEETEEFDVSEIVERIEAWNREHPQKVEE